MPRVWRVTHALVTHEEVGGGRYRSARSGGLTRTRQLVGLAVALAVLPLLTLVLVNLRGQLSLPSDILLFLVAVVGVALAGGVYPALFTAIAGSLLLNYYFVPPVDQFTVNEPENILALVAYIVVALAVSVVVDIAARRTRQATRAGADAELLSNLAASMLRGWGHARRRRRRDPRR